MKDLAGVRFGRLTVMRLHEKTKWGPKWVCRCDCGKEIVAFASNLRRPNHTTSCGCRQAEIIADRNRVNGCGISRSDFPKEYNAWAGAKQRTSNPIDPRSKWYLLRGIKMCAGLRDKHGFSVFMEVLGAAPSPASELDRVDVNGHYSCGRCSECVSNNWPLNIRWATKEEQMNNMTTNHFVEWKGSRMTIAQLARQETLNVNSLYWRIGNGESLDEAVDHCRLSSH